MAEKYDIGFGPYKGPDRIASGTADVVKKPGETLEDGTAARPAPTTSTLTISGLTLTTGSSIDAHGVVVSWVRAVWNAPPQGEHPTDPNAVGDYEFSYTDRTAGYRTSRHEARDVTVGGLKSQAYIDVRVRARTNKGVYGPYLLGTIQTKRDSDPPPVPSAPILDGTLRGLAIRWDGTFTGGALTPDDFLYVVAEFSKDSNFPPSQTVVCGERMSLAGTTAVYEVGTPPWLVYARLRSVDTSGNKSLYSPVVSTTGIRIIPEDVGEKAITTAKLADAAVQADQIAESAVTAFGIAPGAVTSTGLADLAVTTRSIVDGAMTAIKLAADSVTASKIVDGAVVSAKLADLAITSAKVAANAITVGKIGPNAVDNLALIDGAATTSKIAQSAITSDLLAQFAVTAQKVGFGIGGGNQLLNSNFADRGDPATPLAASVVPHWEPDASCTLQVVASSVVPGTKAVETTFDPNIGQLPALA